MTFPLKLLKVLEDSITRQVERSTKLRLSELTFTVTTR